MFHSFRNQSFVFKCRLIDWFPREWNIGPKLDKYKPLKNNFQVQTTSRFVSVFEQIWRLLLNTYKLLKTIVDYFF